MSELARLCFLIEKCNVHARARNNAYLRNYRGQSYVYLGDGQYKYISRLSEAKLKANDEAYEAAIKLYAEARKKYGKEILKLTKKLELRLQVMNMCPIVQNIYSLDYRTQPPYGPTLRLNGKAIRDLAANYEAERILLE